MKMKLIEIFNRAIRLGKLNKEMSIKCAYCLDKNRRILNKEAESYIDMKNKALEKHVERDENGEKVLSEDKQSYVLKDKEAYKNEIEELDNVEIEVIPHTMPFEVFEAGIPTITPQEFELINFMIEEKAE